MPTKRTNSKIGERVSVAEEQLNNLREQLPEMKDDLKTLVKSVGEIQVSLVKLPTWDAVNEVKAEQGSLTTRVSSLESARSAIKVGWAVISTLGGIACVVIGWAISIWVK